MTGAVLFDLGGTLVHYFERAEFPGILEQAIAEVSGYLQGQGLLRAPPEAVWQRVQEEDHEAADHRVRPLEGRLVRIYQLDAVESSGLVLAMCRRFLRPILARGRRYEDAVAVLQELRRRGLQTAIVSNTTWGSPAQPWREEIERQGLAGLVDVTVFCRDVGWRKPARQIFEFAVRKLGLHPQDCLFVGDDPRWDVEGPRAVGMEAVQIDRSGVAAGGIPSLGALRDRLQP